MAKIIGVIPARYASTRLPGKPLVSIDGKPLLQWVIEGAQQSQLLNDLIVATDDERIYQLAVKCGVQAKMTETNIPSGTDRVYAAIKNETCDSVLNIQGDEPLITGLLIDQLAQPFCMDSHLDMATLAHSLSEKDLQSPHVVKVILNTQSEAIYFSRFPIPHSRVTVTEMNQVVSLKHIGMYGYSKKFLKKYCESSPVAIEKAEGLEQLRALYLGARIKVIQTNQMSLGIDTPEDVEKMKSILSERKN